MSNRKKEKKLKSVIYVVSIILIIITIVVISLFKSDKYKDFQDIINLHIIGEDPLKENEHALYNEINEELNKIESKGETYYINSGYKKVNIDSINMNSKLKSKNKYLIGNEDKIVIDEYNNSLNESIIPISIEVKDNVILISNKTVTKTIKNIDAKKIIYYNLSCAESYIEVLILDKDGNIYRTSDEPEKLDEIDKDIVKLNNKMKYDDFYIDIELLSTCGVGQELIGIKDNKEYNIETEISHDIYTYSTSNSYNCIVYTNRTYECDNNKKDNKVELYIETTDENKKLLIINSEKELIIAYDTWGNVINKDNKVKSILYKNNNIIIILDNNDEYMFNGTIEGI